MKTTIAHCLLGLLLVGWTLSAQAVRYGASMNQAEWRLELSPFECRLWQPIPFFGDAVFSNRAGEEQSFYLSPIRESMKSGEARLVSKAPVWDEGRSHADLGLVNVSEAAIPLTLDRQKTFQLLNALYDGMSPVFRQETWYGEGEQVELALSSINFRKAYSQYQQCLTSLLPVNFDQINRSRLHFQTAKFELTGPSRITLNQIVQYVKADPSITSFFIDGHTDDVGRRLANLELSKKRAEAVTQYLMANGVSEAMITTRYHGERYPVVENTNSANRAANRRVTIRLERDTL